MGHKNMKKQQKTETPQNNHKNEKIRVNLCKSVAKIMKNEANFNNLNSTATTCPAMAYNDLSPKTQNGTKPNEANLNPILARRPPGVVTSTKTGNSATLKNFFSRNKANSINSGFTTSPCSSSTYTNLPSEFQQKSKPNPNPKQTQYKPNSNPISKHEGYMPVRHQFVILIQSTLKISEIIISRSALAVRIPYLEYLLCYYRTRQIRKTSAMPARPWWTGLKTSVTNITSNLPRCRSLPTS